MIEVFKITYGIYDKDATICFCFFKWGTKIQKEHGTVDTVYNCINSVDRKLQERSFFN